ncbi:pirin family protein [Paraburkholderia domus]|uniref:pirin family protein n=1 Tax=Paraburkholderia domus TaxID=2793075 RepID=UPI001B0CB576|nr:pirin family protein [Paraburkholderia domus]CAE6840888.1 hypothetical protein R75483_07143 [Paraburkholderia domus]
MPAIKSLLTPHERDLGDGIIVRRFLPAQAARSVGPFVFLDHLGPVTLAPGKGLNVRPHPHIGLATVTYLFEGELVHRDSIGYVQRIAPGDVNWMTSGRGITHSERSPVLENATRLHGIQTWVALPKAFQDIEPSFAHHDSRSLPKISRQGVDITVIAGDFLGERSPVEVFTSTLYVAMEFATAAIIRIPADHAERAIYPLDADITVNGTTVAAGTMAVLATGHEVEVTAASPTRFFLLGGAPLDGPRFMYWNFVSSSEEAIEEAKRSWEADEFPPVRGETDRIPLPPPPAAASNHQ